VAVAGWLPVQSSALAGAAAGLAVLAWGCRARSPRAGTLLLALAALLLGARGERLSAEAVEQRCGWLPGDGRPLELELRGRVLASPEIDVEGQRRLLIDGRPVGLPVTLPALRVALRVADGSAARATIALDALRAGDVVRVWCRLWRPVAPSNPGASDPRTALRARGLDAVGRVKSPWLVEPLRRGPPGARRWIDELRALARSRLDRAVGRQGTLRGLLGAVLLGERSRLAPELQRRWRASGVIHLIAISGLHVGLLIWLVVETLRRARCRGGWIVVVGIGFVAGFATLVGARPSVLRASLGVAVLLCGRAIGRDGDALNSLAAVALLLVAGQPGVLWDAGFQLSFLASAGILAGVEPISRWLPFPRLPARALAVSVCAYVATAPLSARHFGLLAPLGTLVNLPAVPACGLLLLAGYGALLLDPFPGLGPACWTVAATAGAALDGLTRVGAILGATPLSVAAPSGWTIAAYYGALLLWRSAGGGLVARRPSGSLAALATGFAVLWLHLGPQPTRGSGVLVVDLIDVGQAQAILLRGARGAGVLVDAAGSTGPAYDPGERVVLPYLRRQGLHRLEVLLLTHEHIDHAGGAAAVLRGLEVGELWLGPLAHRHVLARELAAQAVAAGTAIVLAERGTVATRAGIALRVLAPGRREASGGINDDSLVLRVGTAPTRLLIPGDLERAGEAALVRSGAGLRAEALVLSHHGSRNGTTPRFLDAVSPSLALVSAGRGNTFEHPHLEVRTRLSLRGIPLWRTDRDGRLRLSAQPWGWSVEPFRPGVRDSVNR